MSLSAQSYDHPRESDRFIDNDTDNEEPRRAALYKDKLDPSLVHDRTLKLDPIFEQSKIENADPNVASP